MVIAIFSLFHGITSGPKKTTPQLKMFKERTIIIPERRSAKRTRFTSWGRNPFSLENASIVSSGLKGILWDKENPKAIINDNIVGIGDKVDANTVVDIKQDRVILNNGAQDFELKLGSDN